MLVQDCTSLFGFVFIKAAFIFFLKQVIKLTYSDNTELHYKIVPYNNYKSLLKQIEIKLKYQHTLPFFLIGNSSDQNYH